jgi:hypothetical protein
MMPAASSSDYQSSCLAMLHLLKDAYFHNRQEVFPYNITEGKKGPFA